MEDGADKGSLYSKWFILQMTGSLESLPSFYCCSSPKRAHQGRGKVGH